MDLGGARRGVDMGPSAIRLSGVIEELSRLGHDVRDFGNVIVRTRATLEEGDSSARHAREVLRACASLAEMTGEVLDDGRVPVHLGGDHSLSIGSLWAMAKRHGPGGVIWIDAHADLNTPDTSPSGNVHGMPLAAALGMCANFPDFRHDGWPQCSVDPRHAVLVGIRELDPGERRYLRSPGAPTVFTMSDIDHRGLANVMAEAIAIASGAGFLHVSLDLDVVDPADAPGVGTPVRGGLTYREAHTMMEQLSDQPISSLDVVEVNPVLDTHNTTGELACELVCSLLGKRIL